MSGKYRLLLAFWGGLFLASAIILFLNLPVLTGDSSAVLPPLPGNGTETENGGSGDKPGPGEIIPEEGGLQWSLVLATVSALVSAAGFMATTYFAVRNDRRQARLTELEIKKLTNEIERQSLEIENLRQSQQKQEDTK